MGKIAYIVAMSVLSSTCCYANTSFNVEVGAMLYLVDANHKAIAELTRVSVPTNTDFLRGLASKDLVATGNVNIGKILNSKTGNLVTLKAHVSWVGRVTEQPKTFNLRADRTHVTSFISYKNDSVKCQVYDNNGCACDDVNVYNVCAIEVLRAVFYEEAVAAGAAATTAMRGEGYMQ